MHFFDRFSGMSAAVGIVLILMIVTWLGLWGPVNLEAIKGWQILIAGCLAICAAIIGFFGSSANARFSAKVHREDLARRKLALFIKIEFACRQLVERGRWAEVLFPPIYGDTHYPRGPFVIDEPAEIEEAWTYLDVLPRDLISEIRTVRNTIRELAALLKKHPEDRFLWPLSEADQMPYPLSEMSNLAHKLWQSAAVIADTLDPLIIAMAPEMDQNDKLNLIYGDPPEHDDYDFER